MSDLSSLPAFADEADAVNVVIESPRGSTMKFKYDAKRRVMTLSRPLILGLAYPYDWGFVPSTRAADGDPLDAFVMWEGSAYPGIVMPCRAIGVLRVEQKNPTSGARERNDRIAVVPAKAPRLDDIHTVFDFDERVRGELERFFTEAVAFENKHVRILGWAGPGDARELIGDASVHAASSHAAR